MTDGRIFLGLATLVCLGATLNGLRFMRMKRNPWAGKALLGFKVGGADLSVSAVNRIGLVQLVGALLLWLFFAAMCFGFLGPVDNIQIIKFN